MFHIVAKTLDASGSVINTVITRVFAGREEAVTYLDRLVAELRADPAEPNPARTAGYNGQHSYWWTRDDGVVTRYTIEV